MEFPAFHTGTTYGLQWPTYAQRKRRTGVDMRTLFLPKFINSNRVA